MSEFITTIKPAYRDAWNVLQRHVDRYESAPDDDSYWKIVCNELVDLSSKHNNHPAAMALFAAAFEQLEIYYKERKRDTA